MSISDALFLQIESKARDATNALCPFADGHEVVGECHPCSFKGPPRPLKLESPEMRWIEVLCQASQRGF